jgi:hypothetical protein
MYVMMLPFRNGGLIDEVKSPQKSVIKKINIDIHSCLAFAPEP